MKTLLLSFGILFSGSAFADVTCTFDGSIDGISEVRLDEQADHHITTSFKKFGSAIFETGAGFESIGAQSFLLTQSDFISGLGVNKVLFEVSPRGYRLVELNQCDSSDTERGCVVNDFDFHVVRQISPLQCGNL